MIPQLPQKMNYRPPPPHVFRGHPTQASFRHPHGPTKPPSPPPGWVISGSSTLVTPGVVAQTNEQFLQSLVESDRLAQGPLPKVWDESAIRSRLKRASELTELMEKTVESLKKDQIPTTERDEKFKSLELWKTEMESIMSIFSADNENNYMRFKHKIYKKAKRKRWRKRRAQSLKAERAMLRALQTKREKEIDEWRRKNAERELEELELEKKKEEERRRYEIEEKCEKQKVKLRGFLDKLRTLHDINKEKMKRQGHLFPEDDDAFYERVRQSYLDEYVHQRQQKEKAQKEKARKLEEEKKRGEDLRGKNQQKNCNDKNEQSETHDHSGDDKQQASESNKEKYGNDYLFEIYDRANVDLDHLIKTRRLWDAYIVAPGTTGTRIPRLMVEAPLPSDRVWYSHLKNKDALPLHHAAQQAQLQATYFARQYNSRNFLYSGPPINRFHPPRSIIPQPSSALPTYARSTSASSQPLRLTPQREVQDSQLIPTILQPTRRVSQPTRPVSQPTRSISQPTLSISQPTPPISQPTRTSHSTSAVFQPTYSGQPRQPFQQARSPPTQVPRQTHHVTHLPALKIQSPEGRHPASTVQAHPSRAPSNPSNRSDIRHTSKELHGISIQPRNPLHNRPDKWNSTPRTQSSQKFPKSPSTELSSRTQLVGGALAIPPKEHSIDQLPNQHSLEHHRHVQRQPKQASSNRALQASQHSTHPTRTAPNQQSRNQPPRQFNPYQPAPHRTTRHQHPRHQPPRHQPPHHKSAHRQPRGFSSHNSRAPTLHPRAAQYTSRQSSIPPPGHSRQTSQPSHKTNHPHPPGKQMRFLAQNPPHLHHRHGAQQKSFLPPQRAVLPKLRQTRDLQSVNSRSSNVSTRIRHGPGNLGPKGYVGQRNWQRSDQK